MSAYLIQIFIPAASESTYSGHNADDTFIFKLFQIQTFSDSVKIYICKHFDGSIIPHYMTVWCALSFGTNYYWAYSSWISLNFPICSLKLYFLAIFHKSGPGGPLNI